MFTYKRNWISGVVFASTLLVTQASYAESVGIISEQESHSLSSIDSIYRQGVAELDYDSLTTRVNQLRLDLETRKNRLNELVAQVDLDVSLIKKQLVTGTFDPEKANQLNTLSSSIAELKTAITEEERDLVAAEQRHATAEDKVQELDRERDKQLNSLYFKIKQRHILIAGQDAVSRSNGSIDCSVSEALMKCLNRHIPSMKSAFVLENGGQDSIQVTDFKVVDANQSLSGQLNYSAEVNYRRLYSANTDKAIKKRLGLDKTTFVLRSNAPQTTYFIEGEEVGRGINVEIVGNYDGQYNIKVVNGSQTQSLKLKLESGGDYYFPFNRHADNTSSSTATPVSKVATLVQKVVEVKSEEAKVADLTQEVTTTKKDVKPNKVQTTFANIVLHKDDAFTYLAPVSGFGPKAVDVLLSRTETVNYCEQVLSSRLASEDAYRYLDSYSSLPGGSYWTSEGGVYSSTVSPNGKAASEPHKFVCMVSMVN